MRVGDLLFRAAPHILHVGLGVKRLLLCRRELFLQLGDPRGGGVRPIALRRFLQRILRDPIAFGQRRILIVHRHRINLCRVCAVKSTIGTIRA